MTTMESALDMQSSYMEPGKQIVSSVVAKLNHGDVAEAVDHFGGEFKFSDHALGTRVQRQSTARRVLP